MAEAHRTIPGTRIKDLSGQKIKDWTVVRFAGIHKKRYMWECQCCCGATRVLGSANLTNPKSCRCCFECAMRRQSTKRPPLEGRQFGCWTVLSIAVENRSQEKRYWTCQCRCGSIHQVVEKTLVRGISTQCRSCGSTRDNPRDKIPEYSVWCGMINRCENHRDHAFSYYGGRGISICPRWRTSFDAFLEDMGPRPSPKHSIDRKDNDGNYEPGNCRWATHTQQMRNRTSNRTLTLNGQTKCVREWSKITGIHHDAIYGRLRRGWSDERTLTTPVQRKAKVTH